MGRPRPWRCARAARRRRRGQCYGSGQRRTPDDPFFAAGDDMERKLLAKHCGMLLVMVALDLSEDDRYQLEKMEVASANTLFCPIAGCGAHLDCLENFDDHCRTRHTASCCVCSRVYPTSRLLSIHISVVHDSFFQAKVARGFPMDTDWYIRNMICFQFKQAPDLRKNEVDHADSLLKGKGISRLDI